MNRRALALPIVALAAACSSSTNATRSASSTTPVGATSTTAARPHTTVPHAALASIANRYRSACKSPGAAIGVREAGGATRFAVSGRFAPRIALGTGSEFLAAVRI